MGKVLTDNRERPIRAFYGVARYGKLAIPFFIIIDAAELEHVSNVYDVAMQKAAHQKYAELSIHKSGLGLNEYEGSVYECTSCIRARMR